MTGLSSSLRRIWAVLALLLAAMASIHPAAHARQTHIAAQLISEGQIAPGSKVTLAIRMTPEPGWHGYWLNPGDAGLGMRLEWDLPKGASVGEPHYPVPSTLLISGLMNHVYEGEHAILIDLTAPDDAKAGDVLPITVDAQWLACTDKLCVPEAARLETQVTVGRAAPEDPRFAAWRTRLPAPLDAQGRFEATRQGLRLAIPLTATMRLEQPHLFIAQDKVIAYAAPQRFSRNGDHLVVELARLPGAQFLPDRIEGVLRLDGAGLGLAFAARSGATPAVGQPLADPARAPNLALLLLGALVGGLLLNLMPCVFPILSLKALGLARAGESARHARGEGLAYTAGVVLACLALGGLLLALRAGGEEIGWAFQLQEPWIVAALLLLSVAITANFLGIFELALPGFSDGAGSRGAFATGLLAAFVATPCTGPFMAAAMGAALLLPAVPALALFAALGLGLALPFLALALVPALRRLLPRPGQWMTAFRRWLALPMVLTALALAWLTWRIGGIEFAIGLGVIAGGLIFGLVQVGRLQRRGKTAIHVALAAALVPLAAAIQLSALAEPPTASAASGVLPARPFSQALLDKARSEGRPVFVWMTADWCVTCKVNEQVAIERVQTAAAFRKAGVVVLRGDWTRRDAAITRYLEGQGAAGVPFYKWYPANGGAPQQLPQVLAPGLLADLVEGR